MDWLYKIIRTYYAVWFYSWLLFHALININIARILVLKIDLCKWKCIYFTRYKVILEWRIPQNRDSNSPTVLNFSTEPKYQHIRNMHNLCRHCGTPTSGFESIYVCYLRFQKTFYHFAYFVIFHSKRVIFMKKQWFSCKTMIFSNISHQLTNELEEPEVQKIISLNYLKNRCGLVMETALTVLQLFFCCWQ